MKDFFKRLLPVDIISLIYFFITAILLVSGYKNSTHIWFNIGVRTFILIFILFIIQVETTENQLIYFIRNFYPLIFLGYFYNETSIYNHLFFSNFDPFLFYIENAIFGYQPSLLFSQVYNQRWVSEIMHLGYFSYYPITFIVLLAFYRKRSEDFDKAIFLVVSSFYLYYLIFAIFPSIGPQFYFPIDERSVPDGFIFEKTMAVITHYAESETGAFPSSHVGMMTIFILLIYKSFRNKIIYILPFYIIILFATIYLKAHYVIDIIAGALSAPIILLLSEYGWNFISSKKT